MLQPPSGCCSADGTTDATSARSGALAPFGQAKGYALGLAFEVLVGALTASALGTAVSGTLDSERPCNKGDVFIVLEPHGSQAVDALSAYLDEIRTSPPVDPAQPVCVPGDRARRVRAESMARGLTIEATVWRDLCDAAQ